MVWQYVPFVWLPITSALVSTVLGLYAWRRRQVAGARLFCLSMLIATLWAVGYALQLSSADLPSAYRWLSLHMLGPVLVPVVWLLITLQFTGHGAWARPGTVAALLVIPALSLLFLWVGGVPGPMARSAQMVPMGEIWLLRVEPAGWFAVHGAYSYGLVAVILILLARKAWRLPPPYRYQPLAMLLAVVTLMVGHILLLTGAIFIPGLNLTTALSAITYVIFAWGIFRFQLLDVMPVARTRVVEMMADGLIVLDARQHVVDINPAAQRILGLRQAQAIGQPAGALLAAWPELGVAVSAQGPYQGEVSLATTPTPGQQGAPAQRTYALQGLPLSQGTDAPIGRIITLRDVTREREATAERERLIAELQEALGRVKTLSGLLPVCAWCGKIRDEDNQWSDLDTYITRHSDVEITHGICPECERRVRRELGNQT
jgi:hypothetical protein